jgi:imidazolonepropionase-like amidohydrolase
MALTVLSNRLLSDGHSSDLQDSAHVIIQGGRIREVSQGAVPKGERVIDQGGRRMYLGGKSLY